MENNSKKLSVLMVSDYPLGEMIGGSVRVLYEQSKWFTRRGHQVHILTREEQFNKGYKENNDILEWKYPINKKNSITFLWSTIKNCKKCFNALSKKYAFDFICFHQPFSAFSVLRSSVIKNAKKIYICHSLSYEEFQSRNHMPSGIIHGCIYQLNILIRKYLESNVLKKSDIVVVLSQFTAQRLGAVYGIKSEKIRVIPGGIDLERFHPSKNNLCIRQKLNLPRDKMILLTVRSLVPRMGLANLITALKDIVVKAPDVHLILGGEGPLKKNLISLTNKLGLKDYVNFVGFIKEENLPDYYRAADIFVLPTKELEGFGLVTLEALASGLPVLGTPVGGTKEILGKFDPSFIFASFEPRSIAESILEKYFNFKKEPQMRMEVSNRCRDFVERHYSWEKNIDSIERIYSEISKR